MAQISQKFRLYVKNVKGKGRGVFNKDPIPKGAIVEVAPTIRIPIEDDILEFYVYADESDEYTLLGLGYASLYNHDRDNNLDWAVKNEKITFTANRNIAAKQELTINYCYGSVVVFRPHGGWYSIFLEGKDYVS